MFLFFYAQSARTVTNHDGESAAEVTHVLQFRDDFAGGPEHVDGRQAVGVDDVRLVQQRRVTGVPPAVGVQRHSDHLVLVR